MFVFILKVYYTHFYKLAPTAVKFKNRVTAKCIRIHPIAREHTKALRLELTGYPKGK